MKCCLCNEKADITYDDKHYCQSCFMTSLNKITRKINEEKINSKQSR
jgi:hypothetical protein